MKRNYLPIAVAGLCLAGQVFAAKTIPNHAIADLVLGQPDFVTSSAGSPTSSFNMSLPAAIVVDPVSRKVFVSDRSRSRILRYPNASALASGAGAEAVLGQTSFSASANVATAAGISSPNSIFLDRLGRLWITDFSYNRVLMYEAAVYRASSTNADRVYGQPDFTTVSPGTTASKMSGPDGVWVDTEDRLWVADFSNNRVLRFDAITTKASGAAANGVLGQADFVSNSGGASSSKFFGPEGISMSANGSLFVADPFNNRVLRFDNAATLGNGAGANVVFGQINFSNNSPGTSSTTFSFPSGAFITPDDSLWVCDYLNNRVVRFNNASTKTTGAAADGVVGQPNFTTSSSAVTNRGFNSPFVQPFVDSTGSLWVPDSSNNRVLRFPPDVTRPALAVTTKVPKTTSSKTISIKGTATDTYGITKIQYQVGSGSLKTASGTTSWKFTAGLASGSNKIKIFAVDSVGNKSTVKTITIKRS